MASSRKSSGKHRRSHTEAAAAPRVNPEESPLSGLRHRLDAAGAPLIDEAQFDAGERLRVDYTLGQMQPRVTVNWDFRAGAGGQRAGGCGPEDILAQSLAARARLFAALEAVGPELSGILLEICCLSAGLEQAERRLDLPARAGKAVLRLALTRLARHYGLLPREADHRRHPALRHWAAPGSRPALRP